MLRLISILAVLVLPAVMSGSVVGGTGGMMLVKLLGLSEVMALAGNPEQGNGQEKDRE